MEEKKEYQTLAVPVNHDALTVIRDIAHGRGMEPEQLAAFFMCEGLDAYLDRTIGDTPVCPSCAEHATEHNGSGEGHQ